MNFMPATVDGDSVKLPFETVRLPADRAQRARQSGGQLIAGVRPEDFEDASLVGDARDQGSTFRAKIELVESMGSELYAHFTVQSDQQIDSAELRELAEDSGAGEVPGSGEAGRIVARLDPESKVQEGQETELWVNAHKLHLFDARSGMSLTSADGGGAPPATEGQSPGGRDPEAGT
jgi:multiple sugar transport system ATP-binding protein